MFGGVPGYVAEFPEVVGYPKGNHIHRELFCVTLHRADGLADPWARINWQAP